MNKAILAFGLLVLVASPAAAFFENFDDDTAGTDPSGAGYTYVEDGTVAAQQVSASFSLSSPNSFVLNEAGHAVDFQADQDFCLDGWAMEWDFYFDTSLPSAGAIGMGIQSQSVFTVPGATNGQVGRTDGQNLAVLLLVTAGTGDFDLFYRDGSFSETLEVPSFGAAITDSWYHATISLDDCDGTNGGAFDYTLTLENGHLGAPVSQARTQNVANVGAYTMDFFVAGDQTGTGDTGDNLYLDNLCLNFFCSGTGPETPTAPSGLSAIVTQALIPGSQDAIIDLRWPVSSNDPDQVSGDFAYEVFVEGVDVGDDPTTSADGDGQRFNQVQIGGSNPGSFAFKVRARDTVTGLVSPFSCSISVTIGKLGDLAACGAASSPATTFTTPTDTAAGLRGFCASLLGDSSGSLFLCGLIFVVVTFLAVAASFAALVPGSAGFMSATGGTMGAFGMMIFNVSAGIWSLVWGVVLIILTAAIITGLLRKAFMGRGGGAADG